MSRIFRDAVLDLSEHHGFARPLVNSGRLSVPSVYDGSRLNSADQLPGGPARTRPGAPCPDVPLDAGYLLAQLGGGFTLLSINAEVPLEAIARRDPVAAAVARALHDDHARTRANAIRARLAGRSDDAAVDHLESMLCDDRPEHRRSALWVAERLVVRRVAPRVQSLATREADPIVRRRAARCAARLSSPVAAGG